MMNMHFNMGEDHGNLDVLCPDGNVYSVLVIMLCLAFDHEETELHCLKAVCHVTALKTSLLGNASWSRNRAGHELLSLWRKSFRK